MPDRAAFHTLSPADALSTLKVDAAQGLNDAEVAARRAETGFNELQEEPGVPAWKKFLRQFNNLVVWILIVASVIAGATGDWIDTGAILAIVLLNGVLG